jgi:hypothetical protein
VGERGARFISIVLANSILQSAAGLPPQFDDPSRLDDIWFATLDEFLREKMKHQIVHGFRNTNSTHAG